MPVVELTCDWDVVEGRGRGRGVSGALGGELKLAKLLAGEWYQLVKLDWVGVRMMVVDVVYGLRFPSTRSDERQLRLRSQKFKP